MTNNITLNGWEYEPRWINGRPHLLGPFANLGSANLGSADLGSADLRSADLRSANLGSANLGSADLGSADLRSANLGSADLRSADLRSANLRSANLRSANLRSANLGSADLRSADLRSANLRSVINLDKALNIGEAKANEYTTLPEGWKVVGGVIVPDAKEETCSHTQAGPFCSSCGVLLKGKK